MKVKLEIALLTIPLILAGCSTALKSTLLGTTVGGIVGGAIGQNQGGSQDSMNGALIGAGLGGLFAYLVHNDKKKENPTPLLPPESEFPPMTEPKLRSIWVPDKIEGNRLIKGHQVFIIEENSSWKK